MANTYLATPRATVHNHYGEILFEGDILVTFIYEKSRSGKQIDSGENRVKEIKKKIVEWKATIYIGWIHLDIFKQI